MIIILVPDSVEMLLFHYRSALAVQWCECVVLHRKTLLYSHQDYTGSGQSRGSKHQLQRPERADTALRYTTYTTYIELITRPKYVNSC